MPSSIDNIAVQIQAKMAELPFVNTSFGRAYLVTDQDKGTRVPGVYVGPKGEYRDMLPNDTLPSFSFVYIPGNYSFQDREPADYSTVAEVKASVIFFGRVDLLEPNIEQIPTSEYVQEAIKKLEELGGLRVKEVEDQNREVYEMFSAEIDSRFFMWPFLLFRIDLDWYVDYACI